MLSREQIGLEKLNHGCRNCLNKSLARRWKIILCCSSSLKEKARVAAGPDQTQVPNWFSAARDLAVGQLAPSWRGQTRTIGPKQNYPSAQRGKHWQEAGYLRPRQPPFQRNPRMSPILWPRDIAPALPP